MPRKNFSIRLDDDIALAITTYASEHLCTQTEAHMRLLRAGIAAGGEGTLADRVAALEHDLSTLKAQIEAQLTQQQARVTTQASRGSKISADIESILRDPNGSYLGLQPEPPIPLPPNWERLNTKELKQLGRGRLITPDKRTKSVLVEGIAEWERRHGPVVSETQPRPF